MKKILIVLSLLSGTILSAEEFVINFDEYNAKHKNSFAAIREVIDLVRSKNGEPVKIEFNQKFTMLKRISIILGSFIL